MKPAKLIIMYPTPVDVDTFEQRYAQEHIPMAIEKLTRKTCLVTSLIKSGIGQQRAPFYRVAEVYFASMQDLEACLNSPDGQETIQHAIDISTGGTPSFLIVQIENFDF